MVAMFRRSFSAYQALLGSAVLAFGLLGVVTSPSHAREVGGVNLPDTATVQGQPLVLNGAGIRTRVVFKVYAAGLYTAQKSQDANAIINATTPRRVQMVMLRDLGADTLNEALQDGLKKNLSAAALAELDAEAKQLGSLMMSIGKANEGETIILDFSQAGVAIQVGGADKGTVPNPKFASALLRVWLGDQPADAGLKKGMLGG
ncbi:MAG: chalcone isomerase family protein [Proteobacteria bacterium]|nr:chalcone isomerase family protein [Pseudomonadota bacterium]